MLGDLTKRVLKAGLEAEMSDHLGYDKHDRAGARLVRFGKYWRSRQRFAEEDPGAGGRFNLLVECEFSTLGLKSASDGALGHLQQPGGEGVTHLRVLCSRPEDGRGRHSG